MDLGVCWVKAKASVRNEIRAKNIGRVCGERKPCLFLLKSYVIG